MQFTGQFVCIGLWSVGGIIVQCTGECIVQKSVFARILYSELVLKIRA